MGATGLRLWCAGRTSLALGLGSTAAPPRRTDATYGRRCGDKPWSRTRRKNYGGLVALRPRLNIKAMIIPVCLPVCLSVCLSGERLHFRETQKRWRRTWTEDCKVLRPRPSSSVDVMLCFDFFGKRPSEWRGASATSRLRREGRCHCGLRTSPIELKLQYFPPQTLRGRGRNLSHSQDPL